MSLLKKIYGSNDPRDLAAYTVAEAARYVRIPAPTLRAWVAGQSYAQHSGRPPFRTLITAPENNPPRLTFNNLIETYTLRALRTKHAVSIQAARRAIDFAEQYYNIHRLLLHPKLRTSAGDLFLEKYREFVNLNQSGQLVIEKLFNNYLKRIELDGFYLPARLYPFDNDIDKTIVIDPQVAFGRPFIARRGISTAAIVDRVNSGESYNEIAADYGLDPTEVEEALFYEQAA